jgi:nucleoside diphosphate kinase
LVFNKLESYKVSIDGAATFPGPSIGKYSIMDKHYGVINALSKDASKILTKDERDLVFSTLGVKDKNTKILGGHEAYEVSGFNKTYDFDNYWLASPSTKIKSGFYVRTMKIADSDTVVVNGFHPHQLAHYTDPGRFVAVMLVSSDTPWARLRTEMLGETFPEKALPASIRGKLYANPGDYGFDKVSIVNNVMHLSAGPTEALFEIDNFLKAPFGIDFIKEEANLAKRLKDEGISEEYIRKVINDKDLHSQLEHKETSEAVSVIKNKFNSKAS